jgi:hypothetical protein
MKSFWESSEMELTHTKCWPAGVLEARYSVAKQWRSDV